MCDVLNLEWTSSPSRDRQVATLVCNYLRYCGLNIVEGSIFNSYYLLKKHNPKVLFLTNSTGAINNFETVKYAWSKGISVISLVSEGNFTDDKGEFFLWGWNKDKILYETVQCHWSDRARKIALRAYPELNGRLMVSGSVGADLYRIKPKIKKNVFLNKYKKNYSKVIGVGCWDFGVYYEKDPRFPTFKSRYSQDTINRFKNDGKKFNKILESIISANKNILFLIKEHPGVRLGRISSAIQGLEYYDNTIFLKNEESIADCIAISDLWVVYESTSAMEAWLYGIPTAMLNPSGPDFPRSEIHRGNICLRDEQMFQTLIDNLYNSRNLKEVDRSVEKAREEIIRSIIQWDDGLNHVRAGNIIIKIINNNRNVSSPKISYFEKEFVKQFVKWNVLQFLGRIKTTNRRFNFKEMNTLATERMEQQLLFYTTIGFSKEELLTINVI